MPKEREGEEGRESVLSVVNESRFGIFVHVFGTCVLMTCHGI